VKAGNEAKTKAGNAGNEVRREIKKKVGINQ
jgi:hypothetical protein